MKTIGALVALGLLTAAGAAYAEAPPARGTPSCHDRAAILEHLKQRFGEVPQSIGLSADGSVLEILVSPTGSWTAIATRPHGPTCVVSVGKGWQMLPVGEPA